jgi:hypothetical protein
MKNQPDYEIDNSKELKDIILEDLLKMSLDYCKNTHLFISLEETKSGKIQITLNKRILKEYNRVKTGLEFKSKKEGDTNPNPFINQIVLSRLRESGIQKNKKQQIF